MLENINIVLEKKLKIEYFEKIRNEKQVVKSHKFATLTHLENQDKLILQILSKMEKEEKK